jgi:hypothetical protein
MAWTPPYRLLIAGVLDLDTYRAESVWSNVLVLPNFDPGDPPKKLSFRSRRLERAIFFAADMKKADFTNADLRGAWLREAQLQGASFHGAQLQGASFIRAELQGAKLDEAELQGAKLVGAELQGAKLVGARLQGAALDRAQLQGASLDRAQLQGAALDWAELQGASLDRAELQAASLPSVFVWRMVPPASESVEHARIASPVPDAKYVGSGCTEDKCDWTREYYEMLKAKIEAVPAGKLREEAIQRIKPLGADPFTVDEEAARRWLDLAKDTEPAETYSARYAEILIKTGCGKRGAPYVIRGLLQELDIRFSSGDPQMAVVAKAFLEPNCAGARGLSDDEKAELGRLAGPPPN